MRRSSAVLLIVCTVCTVGLCAHSYGAVVVAEYNGYERGVDYRVDGMSQIVILKPSDPELGPYDFDCYDDSTEPPYDPATIQAITAVAGIGDVEIMVRGHEGREYGASNVLLLQLNRMASTAASRSSRSSTTSALTAGWPILRAAKGGGAIRSRGAIALRRCAADAIERRNPVASALHRQRGAAKATTP
jgi:hypothetical protein